MNNRILGVKGLNFLITLLVPFIFGVRREKHHDVSYSTYFKYNQKLLGKVENDIMKYQYLLKQMAKAD